MPVLSTRKIFQKGGKNAFRSACKFLADLDSGATSTKTVMNYKRPEVYSEYEIDTVEKDSDSARFKVKKLKIERKVDDLELLDDIFPGTGSPTKIHIRDMNFASLTYGDFWGESSVRKGLLKPQDVRTPSVYLLSRS